jgi:hypothetical protein
MANFELVLQGFSGENDETDHLVLWVRADCKATVEEFLVGNGLSDLVRFGDDLPEDGTVEEGIDFQLPDDGGRLKSRIAELLAGYEDGAVLGLDTDGCLIHWNGDDHVAYCSGETLDNFGIHNLLERELQRVGVSPERYRQALEDLATTVANRHIDKDLAGKIVRDNPLFVSSDDRPENAIATACIVIDRMRDEAMALADCAQPAEQQHRDALLAKLDGYGATRVANDESPSP